MLSHQQIKDSYERLIVASPNLTGGYGVGFEVFRRGELQGFVSTRSRALALGSHVHGGSAMPARMTALTAMDARVVQGCILLAGR